MTERHEAIGSPALDLRAVAGYDEIAIRAARAKTAGWMILFTAGQADVERLVELLATRLPAQVLEPAPP